MRIYTILIASIIILSHVEIRGQSETPTQSYEYFVEEFTLPGGRLENNVNCIVQGPYGYMWFGSHGGLHRYDGHQFVTYRGGKSDPSTESTTLTNPYVETLYWDSDSMLWVGSWLNGVYLFDPKTEIFKHFDADKSDRYKLSNIKVNVIVEGSDEDIWIGTNEGLNRYDKKSGQFEKYYHSTEDSLSLPNDHVSSLYLDNDGDLWIGTGFAYFQPNEGGLSKYEKNNNNFTNYVGGPSSNQLNTSAVEGILEDSQGNFWVGTTKGLHKMDREKGTFKRMQESDSQPYAPGMTDRENPAVFSISEDSEGGLWVGTIMDDGYESHLLRHDPSQNTNKLLPITTSAWQVCHSKDNTTWVAGAGVSGKVFKITKKEEELKTLLKKTSAWIDDFYKSDVWAKIEAEYSRMVGLGSFLDVCYDKTRNALWIKFNLDNGNRLQEDHVLLAEYDLENEKMDWYEIDARLVINEAQGVTDHGQKTQGMGVDKDGNIWSSLNNVNVGLFQLNPNTRDVKFMQVFEDQSNTTVSNEATKVFVDSRGNIWLGTYWHGVQFISGKSNEVKHFPLFDLSYDSEYNNTPLDFTEDDEGFVWVSGGLFKEDSRATILKIDPESHGIEYFLLPEAYNFEVIENLAVNKDGSKVVFSLQSGALGMLSNFDEFSFYSSAKNTFPISVISDIQFDSDKGFWVAAGGYAAFLWFEDPSSPIYFETDENSSGRDVRIGDSNDNGTVFFLNTEGPDILETDKIDRNINKKETPITFTDLFISNERMVLGKEDWYEHSLSHADHLKLPHFIENFTISFSQFYFGTKSQLFEYRLLPGQSKWTSLSENKISFYQLDPDNYTLQIRPAVGELYSLPITVLSPWWKTSWAYALYGIIFFSLGYLIHLFQKDRTLKKERARTKDRELAQAKKIEKAYGELEKAHSNLKSTQAQLIQSEKMASLGELTAGIAHEIQNPLNFVNNFSEVSSELIGEAKEELDNGEISEVKDILDDLNQNLEKINHHGQRAESIVKGMLQHSRAGTGKKELTDINALCDEYVRLAYHGLRAKDKSFNADCELNFESKISKINVVTQDISRVLLNVLTNAFQAVHEKSVTVNDGIYTPKITCATELVADKVVISISDNGGGIPQDIIEKIFQPFFTTKPTGQGTGLGLSMAYDIVKAHGGELRLETTEGEGSTFIIEVPQDKTLAS